MTNGSPNTFAPVHAANMAYKIALAEFETYNKMLADRLARQPLPPMIIRDSTLFPGHPPNPPLSSDEISELARRRADVFLKKAVLDAEIQRYSEKDTDQ